MVSPAEANYIIESCFADFRIDGRSRLEHRPHTVSNRKGGGGGTPEPESSIMLMSPVVASSTSSLILSNGSSRIHLPGSSTDIICSVKADLVHPSPCKPREGIVELNIDLSLCGNGSVGGMFDGGGGGNGAQQRMNSSSSRRKERDSESQITSLLQRLVLPHAVNYAQLAIMPGRYVWRLSIDIVVLRCDGCIMDACSLALRTGLYNTKLPCVKSAVMVDEEGMTTDGGVGFGGGGGDGSANKNDLVVDGDIRNAMPPPGVENCPLVVTVSVLSAAVPPPTSSTSGNATTSAVAAARNPTPSQQQQRQQPKRRHYISIIDARTEEEVCASSHVCVSIDPCGLVCGVHTLGGGGGIVGEDGLASDGDNLNDGDMIMGATSSSSSMPLAMLGDVIASAAMASKNLYSLLNKNAIDANAGVKKRKTGNQEGNGYEFLLKNHFLIQ